MKAPYMFPRVAWAAAWLFLALTPAANSQAGQSTDVDSVTACTTGLTEDDLLAIVEARDGPSIKKGLQKIAACPNERYVALVSKYQRSPDEEIQLLVIEILRGLPQLEDLSQTMTAIALHSRYMKVKDVVVAWLSELHTEEAITHLRTLAEVDTSVPARQQAQEAIRLLVPAPVTAMASDTTGTVTMATAATSTTSVAVTTTHSAVRVDANSVAVPERNYSWLPMGFAGAQIGVNAMVFLSSFGDRHVSEIFPYAFAVGAVLGSSAFSLAGVFSDADPVRAKHALNYTTWGTFGGLALGAGVFNGHFNNGNTDQRTRHLTGYSMAGAALGFIGGMFDKGKLTPGQTVWMNYGMALGPIAAAGSKRFFGDGVYNTPDGIVLPSSALITGLASRLLAPHATIEGADTPLFFMGPGAVALGVSLLAEGIDPDIRYRGDFDTGASWLAYGSALGGVLAMGLAADDTRHTARMSKSLLTEAQGLALGLGIPLLIDRPGSDANGAMIGAGLGSLTGLAAGLAAPSLVGSDGDAIVYAAVALPFGAINAVAIGEDYNLSGRATAGLALTLAGGMSFLGHQFGLHSDFSGRKLSATAVAAGLGGILGAEIATSTGNGRVPSGILIGADISLVGAAVAQEIFDINQRYVYIGSAFGFGVGGLGLGLTAIFSNNRQALGTGAMVGTLSGIVTGTLLAHKLEQRRAAKATTQVDQKLNRQASLLAGRDHVRNNFLSRTFALRAIEPMVFDPTLATDAYGLRVSLDVLPN